LTDTSDIIINSERVEAKIGNILRWGDTSDGAIEELLDEIAYSEHYLGNEGYRGVEWERVDEVSEDLVISWLETAERRQDHYAAKVAYYKDLLEYP